MLKGKVAVATGSTGGIGLGTATAPAAEGCAIMLNGFGDAATINGIKRDLAAKHGVKVGYSGADMTKPAEIRQMIADATRELGAVDILVNNAGVQMWRRSRSFPPTGGTRSSPAISQRRRPPPGPRYRQ